MYFNFLLFCGFLSFMTGCVNTDGSVNSVSHDVQPIASMTPPPGELSIPEQTPILQIMTTEKLRCGDVEYELQTVNNISRQADDIRLVKADGTITNNLNMPSNNLVQNFGVDWAKKISGGFEITISWGTRIHHEKTFNFVCKQNEFFLTKIKHEKFDTHFPEDSKKRHLSTKPVVPNLPLGKFLITDFLND